MAKEKHTVNSLPNLPWIEKYRPKSFDELIAQEDVINTICKFMKEGRLPHLLLYGPPGTGKTSTILACARELYSSNKFGSMVLELNASDDRGINVVRSQILNFASTKTIFDTGIKLIILDEADAMTSDAQNALRRIVEKFTENVRFCLICNYLNKIIPALQSRCMRFRFGPLDSKHMMTKLQYVVNQEGISVTEDGMNAIVNLSQGDMRKALNILQSTSLAYEIVNEEFVYTCIGHPMKEDLQNMIHWMLNENFSIACSRLKGLALQDMLTELHHFVHLKSIRIKLLIKLADIEYKISVGCSEKIQLSALIAAFQTVRLETSDYVN